MSHPCEYRMKENQHFISIQNINKTLVKNVKLNFLQKFSWNILPFPYIFLSNFNVYRVFNVKKPEINFFLCSSLQEHLLTSSKSFSLQYKMQQNMAF